MDNYFYSKPKAKVLIDKGVDANIPTVVVSKTGQPAQPKKKQGIIALITTAIVAFVMDFLESIVVALSIFVVVYLFIFQPHEIKGISMEPNFHNNEYILTDKISYRFQPPVRGDVVIFKSPKNPDVDYIKRIIGLPGERVKIQNGSVFINGEKLNESYLADITLLYPGGFIREGVEITVPQDKYFVLGDNRPHSSDSREFGPIDENTIIGKAFMRYWPVTEFGLLVHARYNLQ